MSVLKFLKEVYGKDVMSRTQIFEWHKHFVKSREGVENGPKTGRRSTTRTDENITRVNQLVRSDRRLTVQMISEELSLNTESADGNSGVTYHGFFIMTTHPHTRQLV